jgi:hypothetical protein
VATSSTNVPPATRAGSPAGNPALPLNVLDLARQLQSEEIRRLEQFANAHAVLAGGGDLAAARKQSGLDRTVIANHFDDQGHLLVSQAVERTLKGRATEQVERLAALPRALRPVDANALARVLKDNPGATDVQLREAARRAEVSRAALNYLFVAGAPLRDRLSTLPEAQQADLVEAHTLPPAATPTPSPTSSVSRADSPTAVATATPAPAPAPVRAQAIDPLHRRHLEEGLRFEQAATAHLLLQEGQGFSAAARESGLPEQLVASAFSEDGRLLLNAAGAGVAQTCDEATARRFAALPRALDAADLARLAELLHVLPAAAGPLVRESSLQVGVSPEAVAHLFDAGVPMHERLATLPEHQRAALEAAQAGSPAPAMEPSSPQRSPMASTAELPPPLGGGLSQADRDFLERHLFHDSDDSPASSPQRSPTPAELSAGEIAWLSQAFGMSPQAVQSAPRRTASPHFSGAVHAEPTTASDPASRASAGPVATHPGASASASGLSQEVLGAVSEFLRQESEHARKFARGQALLVGGATLAQAARAVGVHASTLGNSFSADGHLLVNQAAERLVLARDPANAAPFAALPRALTRSDLALLRRVMGDNPGASDEQMHAAAMRARISRRAIAHLFGTGVPLRERLASLPADQQRTLGIAVPEGPRQPVAAVVLPQPAMSPCSPAPNDAPLAETPVPWAQPAPVDEMDAILARLNSSPVHSPVTSRTVAPAARPSPPRDERDGVSPGHSHTPSTGGLPDPGTPPWLQLGEPMSPWEAMAFDASLRWAGFEGLADTSDPQEAGTRTPAPPRDAPPPSAVETAAPSPSPWGASRPRTTPSRPPRDFGVTPQAAGASSSAGPSSAPKRAGEDLQSPAAARARREEQAPSPDQPPQELQWGRQAPRTRPGGR